MSDIDPNTIKEINDTVHSGWLVALLLTILGGTWMTIKKVAFALIGRHVKRVDDMEVEHKENIIDLHKRVDETVKIFLGEHNKIQERVDRSEKSNREEHTKTRDIIRLNDARTQKALIQLIRNQQSKGD